MAELNPFFDLFAEPIGELVAALRCVCSEPTSAARAHVASHRVVVAASQFGRVPKTVRQIVSSQDLHDLLGLLHGSSSVTHTSEAEDNPDARCSADELAIHVWGDFVAATGEFHGRQRGAS